MGNCLLKRQKPTLKKGNLIKLNGESIIYRLLRNTADKQGLVMRMTAMNNPIYYGTSGGNVAIYKNSNLDNYLNNTYYNSLSDPIKSAIVSSNISSKALTRHGGAPGSGSIFSATVLSQKTGSYDNKYGLSANSTTDIGSRKVYAISGDEMNLYCGSQTTGRAIGTMFINAPYAGGENNVTTNYVLTRDTAADVTEQAGILSSYNAYASRFSSSNSSNVADPRPTFIVDLSKVEYSVLYPDGVSYSSLGYTMTYPDI